MAGGRVGGRRIGAAEVDGNHALDLAAARHVVQEAEPPLHGHPTYRQCACLLDQHPQQAISGFQSSTLFRQCVGGRFDADSPPIVSAPASCLPSSANKPAVNSNLFREFFGGSSVTL